MDATQSEVASDIVAAKLSDRALLRNYCSFAGLHRALIARTLVATLGIDQNQRRSIGLEILSNYAAALEDLALWFFVLKEWKMGEDTLFDLLDTTNIRESDGHGYSSQEAVNCVATWTVTDLRREFGLPTDEELRRIGWTGKMLDEQTEGLADTLQVLQAALKMRTENERILVSSYNKIKHGVLAVATTECSSIGVSVMLPSRRGQTDPVSGKRKINTGWIACDDQALRRVAEATHSISLLIWAILNLIYVARFDAEWKAPPWPGVI